MPQLNPAPWFTTLIMTWALLILLMNLLLKPTQIMPPTQAHKQASPHYWPWTWQ